MAENNSEATPSDLDIRRSEELKETANKAFQGEASMKRANCVSFSPMKRIARCHIIYANPLGPHCYLNLSSLFLRLKSINRLSA